MAACEKPVEMTQFNFNARIEQPRPVDGNAKLHLVDEQWIYWDVNDVISIGSDKSTSATGATLTNYIPERYNDFNGVFISQLPANSSYFLGLHPLSENNRIVGTNNSSDFGTPQIDLPAVQPYATDVSFASQVFPMVAWYGGVWENVPFNLDFHALAGLVRLQIFNNGTSNKEIKEIRISSSKQLKGIFNVVGYKTYYPYLNSTTNTDADKEITIKKSSGNINFPTGEDGLLSFYVALPAIQPTGTDSSTVYSLSVTVVRSDDQECTKTLDVAIRRNGITYAQALGLGEDWSATPRVVGNGTPERPFKIYHVDDLVKLRNCYNSTARTINGQPISSDTYIRIMRSDITLTNSNWTTGISHFVGHMEYYGTNSTTQGITNNSSHPLFEQIDDGGEVRGLTVKTDATVTVSGDFSPLCHINQGNIVDCHFSSLTASSGDNPISRFENSSSSNCVAGICVFNSGTISGCGSTAHIATSGCAATGICCTNEGTITGCYAASDMRIVGASRASGICDNNQSLIEDSYFAARITSSTIPWGGIVYNNRADGTIFRCYASNTATIITSASVGGIVASNSGTVNNCRSQMPTEGNLIGMIAMEQTSGNIINSYVHAPSLTLVVRGATGKGGGFVGRQSGGAIKNSYVFIHRVERDTPGGLEAGFVANYTGGTIDNCYVYEKGSDVSVVYGSATSTTGITNCYLVNNNIQDGVEHVAPATEGWGTSLAATLNGNSQTGYYQWTTTNVTVTGNSYTVPSLVTE